MKQRAAIFIVVLWMSLSALADNSTLDFTGIWMPNSEKSNVAPETNMVRGVTEMALMDSVAVMAETCVAVAVAWEAVTATGQAAMAMEPEAISQADHMSQMFWKDERYQRDRGRGEREEVPQASSQLLPSNDDLFYDPDYHI